MEEIRETIQRNLKDWLESFQTHLPPGFCEPPTKDSLAFSNVPTIAYYGLHLYHCMHILLYGQLDLICMYQDTQWQASPAFIKAGEHAVACANVRGMLPVNGIHVADIFSRRLLNQSSRQIHTFTCCIGFSARTSFNRPSSSSSLPANLDRCLIR